MHVDGGTVSQVFFRGFLLDFDDALGGRRRSGKAHADLYIITNMPPHDADYRWPMPPRMVPIASTMIEMLFDIAGDSSLFRMYVLAHRYNAGYHLALFPAELQIDPIDFSPEKTKPLFDVGFKKAQSKDAWQDYPPGLDPDEIYEKADHPADQKALVAPQSKTTYRR